MVPHHLVEPGDALHTLGQPASGQSFAVLVLDSTSWWASAQSTPTKIINLAPLHRRSLHEPEDSSSFLMDQCSRHDIPPAVRGDLTDQQGHDLTLGLKARPTQCSPVGGSVTSLTP